MIQARQQLRRSTRDETPRRVQCICWADHRSNARRQDANHQETSTFVDAKRREERGIKYNAGRARGGGGSGFIATFAV